MENALLVGLSRQVALARELDVIANNMANVGTNGFRRAARASTNTSCRAPRQSLQAARPAALYVIDKGTPLDLSQGVIERTGNPLDVALKDDNYLVAQTPNGERYTRGLADRRPGRTASRRPASR